MALIKAERPGGFLDFLPKEFLAREKIIQKVDKVFRLFGFNPVETPMVEFVKTLSGETSDTGKHIFYVSNAEQEGDEPLALRFDQTVPLARLLAANPYEPKARTGIRLPWRRSAVGPVFRGEKPQNGRYRQFYQFDADIAGTDSMMADTEIVAMVYEAMTALGLDDFVIRLNNRKILSGLADLVGIKERGELKKDDIIKEMMRILDKIDKIGIEKVLAELEAKAEHKEHAAPELSTEVIKKIKSFLEIKGDNAEKLKRCAEVFVGVKIAEDGIKELQDILGFLEALNVPSKFVEINFSIARGLDYYTGPVMETILNSAPQFGSLFSGGRYNNLVSRFTGQELPAVGASIGIDRLFAALEHLGKLDMSQETVTTVMILRLTTDNDNGYLSIATELRQAGINTEICLLDDTTFKNQFNFAISRGVEYIIIMGEDEIKKGVVQVKNLKTREQVEVVREKLKNYFKK